MTLEVKEQLDAYVIDVDIQNAVDSLTVGQRLILKIKMLYGCPAKIIAVALEKSNHTINQQLKLIRQKFNGASIEESIAMIRKAGITLAIVGSIFSITPHTQGRNRAVRIRSRYRIEYNINETIVIP